MPDPVAVCPDCHRPSVLIEFPVYLSPISLAGDHVITEAYGNHFPVPISEEAFCNSAACHWTGSIEEAVKAAEGAVESTRGNYRVWVQP